MEWVPTTAWLTKVAHRRRCAAAGLRPGDRCLRGRRAVAGRRRVWTCRARSTRRWRRRSAGSRRHVVHRRSASAAILLLIRHRPDDGGGLPPADGVTSSAARRRPGRLALVGGRRARAGADRDRRGVGRGAGPRGRPGRDRDRHPLSRFTPTEVIATAGVPVTIVLRNDDPIDHEWLVGDEAFHDRHRNGTEPHHGARPTEVSVPAGATVTTTVMFPDPGEYRFICHLPGHEAYGMVGVLRRARRALSGSAAVLDAPAARARRRAGPAPPPRPRSRRRPRPTPRRSTARDGSGPPARSPGRSAADERVHREVE